MRWRACWPSTCAPRSTSRSSSRTAPARKGGSACIAVKGAEPDGKTILLTPVAPMSVYQHVYKALLYDPIADFEPISQVATFDFAIAVGPQVPAKTLKELVEWVKANPAQGNYGTPAAGTLPHFFAVSFAKTAGLDLRHVGYRGSAAALTDLVGGQISIVVTTTSDVLEQHKAGRIKVLATSDAARSPFLPDVPTFKEAGYDIVGSGWYGVFAPAKTPADVVARLNAAIVAAVQHAAGEGAAAGLRPGADGHFRRRARPHPEGRFRALGPPGARIGLHAGAVGGARGALSARPRAAISSRSSARGSGCRRCSGRCGSARRTRIRRPP